jgi:predicted amidohydrolase
LPFLGVDSFVVRGNEMPVWETPLGRIGIEICHELRFPEVTRTPALRGADIVAHPTANPVAARIQIELITVARAAKDRVYLLTANRVGKERRAEFYGCCQSVDPCGVHLAEADRTEETLLVADVDVEKGA